MKLAEFRDIVDARGADLSTWPDHLRVPAESLLAAEPAARACLDEARRIDDVIARGLQASAVPVDLAAARVLARIARELPRQRRFAVPWPAALLDVDLAPSRWRMAGLAAVAALGIVLGLFGPDIGSRDGPMVIASASAESGLAAVFEPEPLTGVRP